MDEPLDVELTATRWTRSRITCGMQSWSNVFRHGWESQTSARACETLSVATSRARDGSQMLWACIFRMDPFWRGEAMFFLCDAWDGAIVWHVVLPGRRFVRWTLNNPKEWRVTWWWSLWWSWFERLMERPPWPASHFRQFSGRGLFVDTRMRLTGSVP